MYDPDKFRGAQTRGVLAAAMGDLTGHIEQIEEALVEAGDDDLDGEGRETARETVAEELGELFTEFEALKRIADERLR